MSETKKCIECSEEISVNAEICPKCGVRQTQIVETKFCKDCGAKISKQAEICPKCGVRQMNSDSSTLTNINSDKDKTVAGVLAILLGDIGIHKFYFGQTGKGILYLLFCWTLIPAIIALIEGIQILCMSDEKFQKKYFSNK
ncbi:TM2 domain-containing protein [Treponema pectinovorum]|uniref:TM2 domain-containing protein n=1 Tax=Treponema pectinovorum TaxID=164 RepID=UPI0011C754C4|nr:TM2 domain-containing protein [Treponema pectinovorum]